MLKTRSRQDKTAITDALPDMTAMLDILFMLLVFFILTSGATFKSLQLTLPTTEDDALAVAKEHNSLLLKVATDSFSLDKTEFNDMDALTGLLQEHLARDPNFDLVVACDKDVPVQRFLDVLALLMAKKITIANILMAPQDSPSL